MATGCVTVHATHSPAASGCPLPALGGMLRGRHGCPRPPNEKFTRRRTCGDGLDRIHRDAGTIDTQTRKISAQLPAMCSPNCGKSNEYKFFSAAGRHRSNQWHPDAHPAPARSRRRGTVQRSTGYPQEMWISATARDAATMARREHGSPAPARRIFSVFQRLFQRRPRAKGRAFTAL